MNHPFCDWNKHMLTIVQNTLCNHRARWLLLMIKDLSLTNWLLFPSFFFGLGVTNNATKPDCIFPTGDDGSLYEDPSSGKLIVIKNNETQLSWKKQLCQKCKHWQSHFDFLNNAYWVSSF
jgi:hypothetical protein